MNSIIKKIIAKKEIDESDLVEALYEICIATYPSCDNRCPVFEKLQDARLCDCMKNGRKMLHFLISTCADRISLGKSNDAICAVCGSSDSVGHYGRTEITVCFDCYNDPEDKFRKWLDERGIE